MRDLAGDRVLVTGATGFVGRWVARALAGAGAEVTHAVRSRKALGAMRGPWELTGRTVKVDLRDAKRVRALVRDVAPSVVFNLAGYGVAGDERDEATAWALNRDLPRALAEALAELPRDTDAGVRLVHAGTALEYGTVQGDLMEDGPEEPTTLYGESKLEGTRAVLEVCRGQRVPALVARLFTVYGPGEPEGRLLPTLHAASRAAGDARIPLTSGSQRRDFTYVEEVADGMVRLASCDAASATVVNLATGRLLEVRTFVEIAARVLGIESDRLGFGDLEMREEEQEHETVTVGRLERLTGWRPVVEVEQGIERTRDFVQEHGL